MKRLILIIAGLLISSIASAQRVTYNDLLYLVNHNLAEVQENLIDKGYNYTGVDTAATNKQMLTYKFVTGKLLDQIWLEHSTLYGVTYSATFGTFKTNDYILFKNSIKDLGYVMTETTTNKGGMLSIKYVKDDLIVLLSISPSNAALNNQNFYVMAIIKKTNP